MRCCWLFFGIWSVPSVMCWAQLNPAPPALTNNAPGAAIPDAASADDSWLDSAKKTTAALYQKWVANQAPAQKADTGVALIEAAVQSGDTDDVAQVSRGGPGQQHLIAVSSQQKKIELKVLFTLPPGISQSDDASQYFHQASPIFRRMTRSRFEVWTGREGWLFEAHGRLLCHVSVPRRDGDGEVWFGAFLPSGLWITTNLWQDDRQLNCFSPSGQWLWELPGEKIHRYEDAVEEPPPGSTGDSPEREPIHWARSDRKGEGWVVSVDQDTDHGAWISPQGKSRPILRNNPWSLTYPRAMQAKGTYLEHRIPSDDGKNTLVQNCAGHGNWIGFPTYRVDVWPTNVVIPGGDAYFGFWPASHSVWVETDSDTDTNGFNAKVWLLNSLGNYRGEIDGAWLGDAADQKGLLLRNTRHEVITLEPDGQTHLRCFFLHSPETAIPLAIYDDLSLGFFLDSQTQAIVLCSW